MYKKNLDALISGLKKKEFSSVELTEYYLDRIKKSRLNAFITVNRSKAISDAKLADRKIAKGRAHLLAGIPYAHKDIFCTKGIKTSAGSKMLDNFIAPYDATVGEKLNAANMVMLGKTNMDEFAMGASNETSYYGVVKNPWDENKVPGGSSGGSAAALAAGLAPIATGTDTGGSIRQPSAFCGITGLKPTYGRISRYGMIAFASSLDQAGPMARSAKDLALLLNVMSGFDDKDSTSVDRVVPDYTLDLECSLSGLKIGVPREFFLESLDSDVAYIIEKALAQYEKLGAQIHEINLPYVKYAVPTYYIIAPCECSSNLSRYDGVRYGYRANAPKDLEDLYIRSRTEAFGSEVKRRILIGTYALSAGYYDAYYLKAQKMRRLIADDFKKALSVVDVIMGPTTPTTAFDIASIHDPLEMYLSDVYTISANLAGLPAMSIPAGFSKGLPVGLQLIGSHWSEAHLLNIAHQFQIHSDFHCQMPNLDI